MKRLWNNMHQVRSKVGLKKLAVRWLAFCSHVEGLLDRIICPVEWR
jgi:hypothetical protein